MAQAKSSVPNQRAQSQVEQMGGTAVNETVVLLLFLLLLLVVSPAPTLCPIVVKLTNKKSSWTFISWKMTTAQTEKIVEKMWKKRHVRSTPIYQPSQPL